MAIVIREYVDGGFYHKVINENSDNKGTEITEANSQINNNIDPDSIMVDIEGIHGAPYVTRNFTRYMPKCLKGSVPSWIKPYRKPLIKHHNDTIRLNYYIATLLFLLFKSLSIIFISDISIQ